MQRREAHILGKLIGSVKLGGTDKCLESAVMDRITVPHPSPEVFSS